MDKVVTIKPLCIIALFNFELCGSTWAPYPRVGNLRHTWTFDTACIRICYL